MVSTGSDPEDSIVSVHVEATLVTKSGGWSNNRPEQDIRDELGTG